MNQHKMTLFSTSTFAAFVLGATVLGGCVVTANPPDPNNTGGESTGSAGKTTENNAQSGKEYFVSTVFPKLSNCATCHANGTGPQFLGKDGESSYAATKSKGFIRSDSPILKHGAHTGPALKADQQEVVQKWLSLEAANPSTTPGPATSTGDEGITMGQLVAEFRSCMDKDVWNKSKMPLYSTLQTLEFGACAGCHEQGNAGTFISYDPDVTFENSKPEPFIYRYILADYDEDGHLVGLKPSTRLIDKGLSTIGFDSKDGRYIHPSYNLDDDEFNAPTFFASQIIARLDPKTHKCRQPQQ